MTNVEMNIIAKASLLEHLYGDAERHLARIFSEILKENNQINGANDVFNGGVIYKGKEYNASYEWLLGPSFMLDPSLKTEMESYLKEKSEIEDEKKIIKRFLTVLFTKVDNSFVLKKALGENLSSMLRYPVYIKYLDGLNGSQKFEQFLRDNDQYIKMMHHRTIHNLITKGLYDSNQS